MERKPVVVVVGGGLAGLTCAYELGKLGLSPIVLERGGHFGGKVMSSEGYGGLPIEHGVHGWWKGYGNFLDLLRRLYGRDGWDRDVFSGPYFSRFTARLADGRIVTMSRPPPVADEPRIAPIVNAAFQMVKQRAMSMADVASMTRFLVTMIAFDHTKDYATWQDETASGVADDLGVSKRAQELVLANFSLASAFSPLDRISAAAFFSSANFYIFDAQASLEAKWLRSHPDKLVFQPLRDAIEAQGDCVAYARVLGLGAHAGKVDSVYVDRAHRGVLAAEDVTSTPRDLLDPTTPWPASEPHELALARATLRHLGSVWLALSDGGDSGHGRAVPEAWRGEVTRPSSPSDPRWLDVESSDGEGRRLRVLENRFVTLGTLDARDIPDGSFREVLWERTPNRTPPAELERLKANLARSTHLLAMHAANITTPSHLPLYVGRIDGELRAYAGICTHFGGRLRYDKGLRSFACSLHGSRFDARGTRSCGPAEASLLAFRLVDRGDGQVDVRIRRPPKIRADYVVLATDVKPMQHILQASPALQDHPVVRDLFRMRTTSVTVVRFVLGRRIDDVLAIFSGFRTLDALFNVTKLQGVQLDAYRDRVHEVIELQILRDRTAGSLSRDELLRTIRAELKEAYGWSEEPEILEPVHVALHRDVYSGFDPESESVRPTTEAGPKGLVFAADWVQTDDGAWYMERAVRSGRLAARAIAKQVGKNPELVPLVPPIRTAWNLRDLARVGRRGVDFVTRILEDLLGVNREPL
ncbi:MAG: FAD-dependent oxidoreductase [Labilithrix sp.]|nr:FAD-dependent oxidoreductase [Labilithrix sp.]MBX3219093.1 FAD-dependent oxidoreductase [Labilithrix sp.]